MDHDEAEPKDVFYLESLTSDDSEKQLYDIGDGEFNHVLYIDEDYVCIETKKYGSIPRKYRLYALSRLMKILKCY